MRGRAALLPVVGLARGVLPLIREVQRSDLGPVPAHDARRFGRAALARSVGKAERAEAPRDGVILADQGVDQDQIEEQEGDDRDPKDRSPAAAAVSGIRDTVVPSSQPFQSEDRTSKSCPPLHQLLPPDLGPSCTWIRPRPDLSEGKIPAPGSATLLTGFAALCARATPDIGSRTSIASSWPATHDGDEIRSQL